MTTTHTHNPEPETKPAPLLVTLGYDQYTNMDAPDTEGTLFRLVSFSRRHTHYADPDEFLACAFDWEGFTCDSEPHEFGRGGWSDDPDETDYLPEHEYQPPVVIASILDYYEHSMCRWSRSGNGPADYGGFDTANGAGLLLVREDSVEWWKSLDRPRQIELIDGFLDVFTDWANGSIFYYSIDRPAGTCPTCHRTIEPEPVDSCHGFIGFDVLRESWRDEVAYEFKIEPSELVEGIHYQFVGDSGSFDW